MKNTIYSINGPVVTIKGKTDLEMMEMVYVGKAAPCRRGHPHDRQGNHHPGL